jgi:hypothetical protein
VRASRVVSTVVVVLSVAPMNRAGAAGHEQSMGQRLDDYYPEWGERPVLWWGGGADLRQ